MVRELLKGVEIPESRRFPGVFDGVVENRQLHSGFLRVGFFSKGVSVPKPFVFTSRSSFLEFFAGSTGSSESIG